MKPDERAFEDAIEAALLADGYLRSIPSHFDPVLGLDTAELFAFIGATQITEWERLLGRYGNDPDAAQRGFAKRLASELDSRGTVEVLRQGEYSTISLPPIPVTRYHLFHYLFTTYSSNSLPVRWIGN
ncbi:MAG: hypothetical protein ACYDGY_09600, partial [Acidimicrobiales bacterium]